MTPELIDYLDAISNQGLMGAGVDDRDLNILWWTQFYDNVADKKEIHNKKIILKESGSRNYSELKLPIFNIEENDEDIFRGRVQKRQDVKR